MEIPLFGKEGLGEIFVVWHILDIDFKEIPLFGKDEPYMVQGAMPIS